MPGWPSISGDSLSAGDPLPPPDRVAGKPALSFDALYRAQKPKLLKFLRRNTSATMADDLLQATFVRVMSLDRDKQSAIECPEAYLQRSAKNMLRDAAKMERRQPDHLQLWDDEEDLIPMPDPIAGHEARDMLERLEMAMLRLRPLTREIFMAHRLDGYTYREIAEKTGLSVKGVEKHMSRAIAKLDRILSAR